MTTNDEIADAVERIESDLGAVRTQLADIEGQLIETTDLLSVILARLDDAD